MERGTGAGESGGKIRSSYIRFSSAGDWQREAEDTLYGATRNSKQSGLVEEVVTKEVNEDEMLPLKKKYVPLFYKVCNYMIDYSYGRHTYMSSTCRNFVKKNMEIMSDAALTDIVDYLKERNADILEDEHIC